jgi:hypothetical protein
VDWLVLDPLFPADALQDNLTKLRVTLRADVRDYEVGPIADWSASVNITNRIGIADDAAATGGTLRAVIRAIERVGARPSHFAVCAATRESRSKLGAAHRDARWSALVAGHWRISHLRDGCPFLTFTGRRTDHPLVQISDEVFLEVRAPVFTSPNNLWCVLHLNEAIRRADRFAIVDIAARLSGELGRAETIADLHLLGAAVSALMLGGQAVEMRTELATLVN